MDPSVAEGVQGVQGAQGTQGEAPAGPALCSGGRGSADAEGGPPDAATTPQQAQPQPQQQEGAQEGAQEEGGESPGPPHASSRVQGIVKWFSSTKGYGVCAAGQDSPGTALPRRGVRHLSHHPPLCAGFPCTQTGLASSHPTEAGRTCLCTRWGAWIRVPRRCLAQLLQPPLPAAAALAPGGARGRAGAELPRLAAQLSQSNIATHGFRSLRQGEPVEMEVEALDGRAKAVNVTGLGGAPPIVSAPLRAQRAARGLLRARPAAAARSAAAAACTVRPEP